MHRVGLDPNAKLCLKQFGLNAGAASGTGNVDIYFVVTSYRYCAVGVVVNGKKVTAPNCRFAYVRLGD